MFYMYIICTKYRNYVILTNCKYLSIFDKIYCHHGGCLVPDIIIQMFWHEEKSSDWKGKKNLANHTKQSSTILQIRVYSVKIKHQSLYIVKIKRTKIITISCIIHKMNSYSSLTLKNQNYWQSRAVKCDFSRLSTTQFIYRAVVCYLLIIRYTVSSFL